jgi:ketopantoate reductase
MGAYKTSMQIDRQLGRPMEVETIIGEPFRIAIINKNVTHYLGMLYHLLRQLSSNARQ